MKRAAPRSSLRSRAARSYTTSAKPRRSVAGSASAAGCCGPRANAIRGAKLRFDLEQLCSIEDNSMALPITFDHCVVHVSDWERSNAFYRDVLGAELIR